MSLVLAGCLLLASFTGSDGSRKETAAGNGRSVCQAVEKVPYRDVTLTDHFWRPKIEKNRVAGIRSALRESALLIDNFDVAAGKRKGEHKGNVAGDSDVYKIIQGAAYALHSAPDKELEAKIDSLIDRIVAAQQPDGYLFTYWTINDLSQKWKDIPRKHELYCAGHLIEAAVAYNEATGKRKLLDAAIRLADHIDSVFGPGKRLEVPGHAEIELALVKLYDATGEKKYLNLSAFFIDERGDPVRIASALIPPEHDPKANTPQRWRPPSYKQDHLPVTKQFYATGHAVRACYLYAAMADVAMETGDPKYNPALDSIWSDIVGRKMYVTGGIGTRQFHDEGFGSPYLLPSGQAYCETCSAVALNFWNRRMNLLLGDAKFADLVELTMYNSVISGVSLSGDRFFYTNPVESDGKHKRDVWDDPPCCPTNMVRFLPEIGSTVYGKSDKGIYVNQFIGSEANVTLAGNPITLVQQTDYPWKGKVSLQVDPRKPAAFALHIRIPAWARDEWLPGGLYHFLPNAGCKEKVGLQVNGSGIRTIRLEKGYAVIDRSWKKGDRVELVLPMKIHMVAGDPRLEDTRNKLVLMRGPLVYCLEEADNAHYFDQTDLPRLLATGLKAEYRKDLLDGVVCIDGEASIPNQSGKMNIRAIPYFAWCNRKQGPMRVWLPAGQPLKPSFTGNID